uniref:Uncharacterized protein n=1 Tax=Oryza glaberrima TaxID=4538 RepID=I1NPH6_ORYGL
MVNGRSESVLGRTRKECGWEANGQSIIALLICSDDTSIPTTSSKTSCIYSILSQKKKAVQHYIGVSPLSPKMKISLILIRSRAHD